MQSGPAPNNNVGNTPRDGSISFFNGSSDVTVNDSTLNAISGDYYQVTNMGSEIEGLKILSQAMSHGAMFDSAERYPAGKCHPGTRDEVQSIILDWINTPSPRESVLWLYGGAGAGKSSIAQTIAVIIKELEKRYAASFFFARSVFGRNGSATLFPTLAYQIATHIPDVRNIINDTVLSDVTIIAKSLDTQMKALIIDPLSQCSTILHSPTVIIDGLDECGNSHTQRDILRLVSKAITNYQVPLRFLIVSRPEFWIRTAFDSDPLVHLTKRVSLGDSGDVDIDIKTYLEDGFAQIYADNIDILGSTEKPWPPPDVVQRLVKEASGQFIYPSIVLKFVGASSDYSDPQAQLDAITQPGPSRSSAFAELDTLYITILSLYPRRESLLMVLGGLLTGCSPTAIVKFLGVSSTEFNLVLRAISSLIVIQHHESSLVEPEVDIIYGSGYIEVPFSHLSFSEFLQDKTRSGPFFIDAQPIYERLIECFIQSIIQTMEGKSQLPSESIMHLDHMWHAFTTKTFFSITPTVVYQHFQYLVDKLSQVQEADSFPVPQYLLRYMDYVITLIIVAQNPLDFVDTNPFQSMELKELFSCLNRLCRSIAFKCIEHILSDTQDRDFLTSMLVYILFLRSATIDDLGRMPGCSPRMAKAFLQNYWYLVKCNDIEGSGSDRVYFEINSVLSYFRDFVQGDARTKFRAQAFLVTYRCLKHILYRYNQNQSPSDIDAYSSSLFQDVSSIISSFLAENRFSDVDGEEQFNDYNVDSMINLLWEYDWKRLRLIFGHYFSVAVSIANWIDRHMKDPIRADALEAVSPGFKERLQHIMKRMYDEVFLPTFKVRFFSELSMYDASCIRTVSLKPRWETSSSLNTGYQIVLDEEEQWGVDVENIYIQSYIYIRTPELDGILSRASYLRHHEVWYTTLLEFYLNTLVKGLYHRIHPEFQSYALLANFTEVVISSIHHVLRPTEKMVRALQALCYLSERCEDTLLPWVPPLGLCSEITGLLKRSDRPAHMTANQVTHLMLWLQRSNPKED